MDIPRASPYLVNCSIRCHCLSPTPGTRFESQCGRNLIRALCSSEHIADVFFSPQSNCQSSTEKTDRISDFEDLHHIGPKYVLKALRSMHSGPNTEMLRIPISHTVTLQNFLISSFYLVGLKTNCQLVNIGSVSNDEYQIDHNNIGGEGGGFYLYFSLLMCI